MAKKNKGTQFIRSEQFEAKTAVEVVEAAPKAKRPKLTVAEKLARLDARREKLLAVDARRVGIETKRQHKAEKREARAVRRAVAGCAPAVLEILRAIDRDELYAPLRNVAREVLTVVDLAIDLASAPRKGDQS